MLWQYVLETNINANMFHLQNIFLETNYEAAQAEFVEGLPDQERENHENNDSLKETDTLKVKVGNKRF